MGLEMLGRARDAPGARPAGGVPGPEPAGVSARSGYGRYVGAARPTNVAGLGLRARATLRSNVTIRGHIGPCGPASAGVIVQVKADGDAEIKLLLPADRKGLDPLQLGDQVSKAIFPSHAVTRRVRLDDQGGAGFPLVRVRVSRAYSPGRRPRLDLDVGGAVRALHDVGLSSVQL